MEKQLKNNEDKRLIAANTYFHLYMDSLEEVIKDDGRIYFCEYGYDYVKVCIIKNESKCWVDYYFWKEFSELFSLQDNQVKSIITRWVEDTYKLTGIYTTGVFKSNWSIS